MDGATIMTIKRIFGGIACVIALVAAFIAVKELKTAWFASTSWQQASQTVAEDTDKKIQTAQREATAGKNATEILIDKSNKDVTAELKASATDKQKHVTASNFFYGAYFLNTRTRAEYCGALGVAIPTFVAAYKQKHRDLFATAETYQIEDFREHGETYDIEKFYKTMQPAMEKYIVQDMKDIASSLHVSEQEACSLLEQNAAVVVDEMDYRKRAPEIAQTLLQK
jgi:hypothetical protein